MTLSDDGRLSSSVAPGIKYIPSLLSVFSPVCLSSINLSKYSLAPNFASEGKPKAVFLSVKFFVHPTHKMF